jgi:Flp pilus assembly protein TadG
MKPITNTVGPRPALPHKRRRFRLNRGEGLVEFAVVLPLFFLLMFGILDMGHLWFVQVTLENAVRQAGRYAVTGASMPGLTRLASIVTVAKNSAPGLDVSQIVISSAEGASVSSNGTATAAGLPGENVKISLTTHLTLFTNLMGHFYGTNDVDNFTVSTTFRNEQFPFNQDK